MTATLINLLLRPLWWLMRDDLATWDQERAEARAAASPGVPATPSQRPVTS